MTDQPILEVKDLQTYFRTGKGVAKAVDGVTFSIQSGETYALVGESGCGKSVTALSILQLVAKPAGYIAGGSILLTGTDIAALPPVDIRKIRGNRIAMIFQEPMTALNPVFSIGNQISEAILVHQKVSRADARSLAVDMLTRVGLPDPEMRFHEYPHQMSGGMRQRVMIAMALACKPEVLIADEPTTALDVTIQSQILKLIRDLKEELGTAVLLITHDMGVVRENADRVGVMYAGRIVEEASQKDLFASPSHPYTRLLLRSIPARTERGKQLAIIKGMVPPATDFPAGCRFSNRCPYVMEICHSDTPTPYSVGPAHQAECFLLKNAPHHFTSDEDAPGTPPSAVDAETTALQIDNLKMHFPIKKGVFRRTVGHVMAVDGVSLKIHKGETLALVGESGCGKTTVGKCIVRLLDPTDGSIRFKNQQIAHLPRSLMKPFRRHVQMIFQDPFSSLNPRMMIRDTITEGMETHGIGSSKGERLETARSLMIKVGLDPEMLSRYPHEFSGGQRQRLGVARALAVSPDLIICDEATSSLDVSVQAQILNMLKQLQSDLGLSYLFITHDLSVVKYLADRVSVMYLGRIVERGTNAEIFDTPKHPYTRALLSAVPQVDEKTGLKKIVLRGDVPSPSDPPSGCHFHPRCPDARPECSQVYPDSVSFSESHSCRCILH